MTITVPLAGNTVTVTCSGEDVFFHPGGTQVLVRTVPLSVITLEYLAFAATWYAVGGDLLPADGAVRSRPELEAVLGEILDDYNSGTGTFGIGSRSVRPETLALIITQRLARRRATQP